MRLGLQKYKINFHPFLCFSVTLEWKSSISLSQLSIYWSCYFILLLEQDESTEGKGKGKAAVNEPKPKHAHSKTRFEYRPKKSKDKQDERSRNPSAADMWWMDLIY